MAQPKAMIALSGGVDSSAAACLMLQAGYSCVGTMMHLQEQMPSTEDARAVAQKLGIPFYLLDYRQTFKDQVISPFISAYEQGFTPNPCIQCNKYLKFGALLEAALDMGCDCIVTGHYCRIEETNDRYLLYKALDESKDQSYFLYSLTQHQLRHTRFPLGGMTKEQARAIAQQQGLLNAHKRDSQDICFIPDGDYFQFMREFTKKNYPCGAFLDEAGNRVGTHQNVVAYTRGQRKGLGIAMGKPVYVLGKDVKNNTVTVGDEAALFGTTLLASHWNFIPFDTLSSPLRCMAKARSRMHAQPATVYPEENGVCRVVFDTAQRALTTGQAVVLYDGDLVIGGGTITEVL